MLALAGCSQPATDESLQNSVVRLDIDTCGGLAHQRATAVQISEDLAATVAHSFVDDSGALSVDSLTVFDGSGDELAANLVYLDPERDLALLRLSGPEPLALAEYDSENTGRMVAFPSSSEPPVLRDILIRRTVNVTLDGEGSREAIELEADITPGDSGAPIVNDNGDVIGVIFATSRVGETGWAIASSEYEEAMAQLPEVGSGSLLLSCP